jgi:hypothetical protein
MRSLHSIEIILDYYTCMFYKLKKHFLQTKTFVFMYPCDVFSVKFCSDASCNRTVQIIRAQIQKQAPKHSNFWTWAHIIPVVNRNHEGSQTNRLQPRSHHSTQHITRYISQVLKRGLQHHGVANYYKPDLESSGSIIYTHLVQVRLSIL